MAVPHKISVTLRSDEVHSHANLLVGLLEVIIVAHHVRRKSLGKFTPTRAAEPRFQHIQVVASQLATSVQKKGYENCRYAL